jgi:hypothetical protein
MQVFCKDFRAAICNRFGILFQSGGSHLSRRQVSSHNLSFPQYAWAVFLCWLSMTTRGDLAMSDTLRHEVLEVPSFMWVCLRWYATTMSHTSAVALLLFIGL